MKPIRPFLMVFLLLAMVVTSFGQQVIKTPRPIRSGLLTLAYTAGSIANGGHLVTVAAGSVTVTASKTSCAMPLTTTCNFVYANSSGTVANTSTYATAFATGNSLLALVETSSTAITRVIYPDQISPTSQFVGGTKIQNGVAGATTDEGNAAIIRVDVVTLSGGAGTLTDLPYTSSTSYGCAAHLSSASVGSTYPPGIVNTSGSTVTLAGTGSEVYFVICAGH